MLRWALRSLLSRPSAFILGVAAAASALLLVMFYEAVWAGEGEKIIAYPQHAGADVWVMQRGVTNMHMATSYISDYKVRQIRNVPGVAAAEPILYLNTVVEAGGRQWFAYVVGLDPHVERTGPWAMAQGKREPGLGEAVVPDVFSAVTGLELGSSLRIVDHEFTIVGLSRDTFSMANSVIFVTRQDVEDIMSSLDIVSFVLVTAADGVSPGALASRIEDEVEKVEALPTRQFLENDRSLAVQMGVETVALMTFICSMLAVLLIGFTVYSQVARQRRELAVAKALGVTNAALFSSVCMQAALLGIASVAVAAVLAVILMPIVTATVPMISLQLTTASLLRTAVAGVLIAILASLIPAWRIARLDPMSAFQS